MPFSTMAEIKPAIRSFTGGKIGAPAKKTMGFWMSLNIDDVKA